MLNTYRTPAIKEAEQEHRGANDIEIVIIELSQRRPKDFKAALNIII
jgi:hypothetical protein